MIATAYGPRRATDMATTCTRTWMRLATLITAMGNWSGPVFNYFDYRVTNAYTESVNRLIADSNRLGRGYSFDVLRTRMLLARGALKQEGLPPGTFGFRDDGEQPFTGVHLPTLLELIENGQW